MASLADALLMQALQGSGGGQMTIGSGLRSLGTSLAAGLSSRFARAQEQQEQSRLAEVLASTGKVDPGTAMMLAQSGQAGPALAQLLAPPDQSDQIARERLALDREQMGLRREDMASDRAFREQELEIRRQGLNKPPMQIVNKIPGAPQQEFIEIKGEPFRIMRDASGAVAGVAPLEGTASAVEREQVASAQATRQKKQEQTANQLWDTGQRALKLSEGWTTGLAGQALSGIGGSEAHDLQNLNDEIISNVSFEVMSAMREQSPTGATGLGQLTEREWQRVVAPMLGSLNSSQSKEQYQYNLKRLLNTVADMVHDVGKGPKRYDLTSPKGEVSIKTGKQTIPPVDQRVIGQEYTNAQGVTARWTGDGWEMLQ